MLEKVKIAFDLKVNSQYQQLFEEKLKLIDENLDEFNLIKDDFFQELSSHQDLFFNNFSLIILRNLNFLDENIIKMLNNAFLILFFKSITYKDPPKKEEIPIKKEEIPLQKEEIPIQKEEIPPENLEKSEENPEPEINTFVAEEKPIEIIEEKPVEKVYPPRVEAGQHDFDMLKAKGKLRVAYEPIEENEQVFNAIVRTQLPLNYNAPRIEEEKEQNPEEKEENPEEKDQNLIEKNQVLVEKDQNLAEKSLSLAEKEPEKVQNPEEKEPKIEEIEQSFIEPFDGSSFLKLKEQYFGFCS